MNAPKTGMTLYLWLAIWSWVTKRKEEEEIVEDIDTDVFHKCVPKVFYRWTLQKMHHCLINNAM